MTTRYDATQDLINILRSYIGESTTRRVCYQAGFRYLEKAQERLDELKVLEAEAVKVLYDDPERQTIEG